MAGIFLWSAGAQADVFVRGDVILDPRPGLLSVCHGNGCVNLSRVSLSAEQWRAVVDRFSPSVQDPAQERERLRSAIALMEVFAGQATGTWRDKGGTLNLAEGQMDCIDESINTTLYLTMFQQFGLMRLHRVEDRATRGWFLWGWPHTTAVIRELPRGPAQDESKLWAVDSWFLDNGEPPYILPLETWKSGWTPEQENRSVAHQGGQ